MFTEADAWNTEDSQFDYLMDRAFMFLSNPSIVGCFQYGMDPRFEGGTYFFGVLQPPGEFSANYNGYWVFRDLRGKMVQTTASGASPEALAHVHVIASVTPDAKTVAVVAYYDTGYFDGNAGKEFSKAKIVVNVKLPPGKYTIKANAVNWKDRVAGDRAALEIISGRYSNTITLDPCHAEMLTFTRP